MIKVLFNFIINTQHCTSPTDRQQLYEYIVEIEISTTDVEVLQQLNNVLDNISLPIRVSDSINITEVNIGKNIVFNFTIHDKFKES